MRLSKRRKLLCQEENGIITSHPYPSDGCENIQGPQVVIREGVCCSLLVIAVTAAIVCANR